MPERLEGLEPPLAADEEIVLAVAPWTRRHDDGLFQADALDVADDLLEDSAVALAGLRTSIRLSGIIRNSECRCSLS